MTGSIRNSGVIFHGEREAGENNAERHALDCARRLMHDLRSGEPHLHLTCALPASCSQKGRKSTQKTCLSDTCNFRSFGWIQLR